MDEEIVEVQDEIYKIGGKAVGEAILYSGITLFSTLILPLSSTAVIEGFNIGNFNPSYKLFVLIIGVCLVTCVFLYNLLYKAYPLYAGVIGIFRYSFVLIDTLMFFLLFLEIPLQLNDLLGLGINVRYAVGAFFLFGYGTFFWYGTLLLVAVCINFLRSVLETAFWKKLRIKKKSTYKK